ncbi:MAG: response regulator [Thermodesulfobacteriota bacterium]
MVEPRILIVDDSAAIRKSLSQLLSPLNAVIAEAENGRVAFDQACAARFDLILTDIEMPEVNGIEFCRMLKSRESTCGIPVVVVSSFDSDRDVDMGFQAGAAAYISKNDAKNCLLETVEGILDRSRFKRRQLILVVDDSAAIRQMVEARLTEEGFRVMTAKNGKEALGLLADNRPDLIVSDLDMPVMDGLEFCALLHADSRFSSIPFVVMSANNNPSYMRRMIQHGAATYLVKPFNMEELSILIEKILSDQFLLLLKEKERLDSERYLIIATITSLVAALEARDAYTRGHSEHVGDIVAGMLSLAGAERTTVENAMLGGKMHDIGKIGIRDDILLKPGRLTQPERAKINQHPVIGADILKSIPSLSNIISIVRHHHERMDGKGYPAGLKGDKIPLWARITAVADTYHALTSDRPYRNAVSEENALQIIAEVSGKQLCPECVELFFSWVNIKAKPINRQKG